jgi:fructose transport system permease protein
MGDMAAMTDNAEPTKTISDFEAKLNEADKTVASFARDDKTLVHKARAFLRVYPTAIPALVLILSVIVFGIIAPRFFSASALSTVLQQVTVTGIVAIAQTLVILTAGIDLSVGAILVVASLVMGNLAVNLGLPVPIAILVGMVTGAVMGWINGVLVAYVKLPPFIVTLGTLSVFTALKLWYSGSESIRNVDIADKARALLWFGDGIKVVRSEDASIGLVVTGLGDAIKIGVTSEKFTPVATLLWGGVALIILAAVFWYILTQTAWGRHVHAIGDDPESAMLSGIRTNFTLVSVYTVAGLICGFAAWIAIGRVGSVSPVSFDTINLGSITAVVIGGTSLFGGRGSIVGSVLGALIVGVFNTGLSLAGVDDYWQMFAAGNLVIIAVALDQWLRRASQ